MAQEVICSREISPKNIDVKALEIFNALSFLLVWILFIQRLYFSWQSHNTVIHLFLKTYISIDAGMLSRGSLSKFLYKNRYIYQDIFRFAWKFFSYSLFSFLDPVKTKFEIVSSDKVVVAMLNWNALLPHSLVTKVITLGWRQGSPNMLGDSEWDVQHL